MWRGLDSTAEGAWRFKPESASSRAGSEPSASKAAMTCGAASCMVLVLSRPWPSGIAGRVELFPSPDQVENDQRYQSLTAILTTSMWTWGP